MKTHVSFFFAKKSILEKHKKLPSSIFFKSQKLSNQTQQKFGLIGKPLTHSYSKKHFSEKFEKEGIKGKSYHLFPLEKGEHFPFLKKVNPNLKGLNVTIPYKETVLPFMDELSKEAASIGAVNCINFLDGKMIGHNTDAYGFEVSILEFLKENGKKVSDLSNALILGTGGASKAIKYVLKKHGIEFLVISRRKEKGDLVYEELNEEIVRKHQLIVNTTPLGTFPNTDTCPNIPYEFLGTNHFLYDLVYNPEKTLFLQKGKNRGANVKNGAEMLYLQAEKSWEIWTT